MEHFSGKKIANWRRRLHTIIYEANTPMGRLFDIALLVFIVISIVIVALDSVPEQHQRYGRFFIEVEWIFTIIFTIEYLLRLLALRRPLRFVFSPLGIIDLLSILPAYLSLLYPGAQTLLVLRAFRLLRIFRIFKLTRFMDEARTLRRALRRSMRKIAIFMLTVATITVILGSVMYLVEVDNPGFSSIPTSIYWATVTITTVGYGDISPRYAAGQIYFYHHDADWLWNHCCSNRHFCFRNAGQSKPGIEYRSVSGLRTRGPRPKCRVLQVVWGEALNRFAEVF